MPKGIRKSKTNKMIETNKYRVLEEVTIAGVVFAVGEEVELNEEQHEDVKDKVVLIEVDVKE